MTETNPILEHWHFPYPPRKNQVAAFDWMEANKDKRYLILEAPVGCGKSNIGLTYSLYKEGNKGNCYVLTPQRILQEQYVTSMVEFEKVQVDTLYGRSNYMCSSGEFSCDIGNVIKRGKCPACPHQIAKKDAQSSPNTVLNYQLALTNFAYTPVFSKRKLIVMDECHTLESYLVEFDTTQVAEWRCKKYNVDFKKQSGMNGALEWIKAYYLPEMQNVTADMQVECDDIIERAENGGALSANDAKKLKELDGLYDHCDILTELLKNEDVKKDFVLVFDDTMFQFKRITGAHAFKKYLEEYADQFIFMSSTILDKDGFCRDLGLDPEQAAFLSLESDFPIDNRPVYYTPAMKVNSGWKNDLVGQKNLLQGMKQVMEMHENDSGVIHTGNFAIAKWLVEKLDVPQKIFHHNPDSGDDRNKVIKAFMQYPKPAVLISPSVTEGLDLKDDLGRFAIFAKVPYGYLGDQWIKRRMDLSNEWYRRQAMIHMIQGGGRVVRGMEDSGAVYIMDECFNMLYNMSSRMVPKWWKEAYIKV